MCASALSLNSLHSFHPAAAASQFLCCASRKPAESIALDSKLAPYHPIAVHGDANRFASPADSQRRLHRFRLGSMTSSTKSGRPLAPANHAPPSRGCERGKTELQMPAQDEAPAPGVLRTDAPNREEQKPRPQTLAPRRCGRHPCAEATTPAVASTPPLLTQRMVAIRLGRLKVAGGNRIAR